MTNKGKEDNEVSDTFRKIALILNKTVLSLTIPEIMMMLKRSNIEISESKIRNSIRNYKRYLTAEPANWSEHGQLSYRLNPRGEKLAESLFGERGFGVIRWRMEIEHGVIKPRKIGTIPEDTCRCAYIRTIYSS